MTPTCPKCGTAIGTGKQKCCGNNLVVQPRGDVGFQITIAPGQNPAFVVKDGELKRG